MALQVQSSNYAQFQRPIQPFTAMRQPLLVIILLQKWKEYPRLYAKSKHFTTSLHSEPPRSNRSASLKDVKNRRHPPSRSVIHEIGSPLTDKRTGPGSVRE